jgi:hypothetical protein
MNSCSHEDREDGPEVLPRRWRGNGGDNTPSEPESSEEDEVEGEEEEEEEEEEGEVTPPPHSPSHEASPSLEDLFCRQAGVTVDVPCPKQTRTDIEPSTGSPS